MRVLMKNPNFLILDEPTNDLDIFVMSVLEEYLRAFQGCLIVVSHDRYFMDKMVDHLFVFRGDGEIRDIIGNYSVFRQQIKEEERQEKREEREEKKPEVQERVRDQKRKLTYKEQQEFQQLEGQLADLEIEKEDLTAKLSDTNLSGEELEKLGIRLSEVVNEIDIKTDRWLELSEFA